MEIVNLRDTHDQHGYRSSTERHVAEELQRLNVGFGYEEAWINPHTGTSVPYLPDFTIRASSQATELELPNWVEVKPQQMLYDLFEDLGLKRQKGDRFTEPFGVPDITSQKLRDRHFDELYKPKRLAEMSGESVLVVGTVRATARLSVEMQPDLIVFSRTHPFVNQQGIEAELERERRRLEWEEIWRLQREERAARIANQQAEWQQEAPDRCKAVIKASARSITPRFDSRCYGCGAIGADGNVHHCTTKSGEMQWFRICIQCQVKYS